LKEGSLDNFEDTSAWTAITSGHARLVISQDQGRHGKAMRLDFDFHGGGGFVVARKAFNLQIPEAYSFGFHIRGIAPPNNFEFKLVDESNQNVWRYRVEAFDFPKDWQPLRIRNSQIDFAWGPLGGGSPGRVAAIELVVAAGPGGKGTVWIDDLWFQDDTYKTTPVVRASSIVEGHDAEYVLNPFDGKSWRCEPSNSPQWLIFDFQQEREYGGVVVYWEKGLQASQFSVEISSDGSAWSTAYETSQGDGERSYIYLPQAVSRYLRFNLQRSVEGRGFGIRGVEIKPYDYSRTHNHFFQNIAGEEAAGLYPRYFLRRQSYWTTVGTGEGQSQALFNEEGMVEVEKGSFSLEPFVYVGDRLFTWADVALKQGLEGGYLPAPFCQWRTERFIMTVTAFAGDPSCWPTLHVRYRMETTSQQRQSVRLFVAFRPFQVTPTWQHWRSFGGVSPIEEISFNGKWVQINQKKIVIPLTSPNRFGAAAFAAGGLKQSLQKGDLPRRQEVKDPFGFASGALSFDMHLEPGSAKSIYLRIPLVTTDTVAEVSTYLASCGTLSGRQAFDQALSFWETKLGTVDLRLPPQAQPVVDTFRTATAHILINRNGPSLQPGPRRYSRSWIRDGAIMGAALLRAGYSQAIRDFILWYRDHQAEDGNIPDCVDGEGTEWLPEFDAYGQFIFSVMEYYRLTGDKAFVAEMQSAVSKALAFMEGLRKRRLTEEYRGPEKRACFGLLPESMSHEGYMAHPVHAYWDDFWALRGLRDAVLMARVLGDEAEAARLKNLLEAFSKDVRDSLAATIAQHRIDFVPGSVEFGDFDPTATSIAVALLDEMALLPPKETQHTFDMYLNGFRDRAAGKVPWNNYSAYEVRIIGALVRLGRRREAMELMTSLLADQRIPAWNQWPEISWRDTQGPSFLGDLPHTWISAEYMLAVCALFAYEREADKSLVIAAGVAQEWLSDGFEVGVQGLPTYYGKISYTLRLEGPNTLRLRLEGGLTVPPGGIVVSPPLLGAIRQVELNGRGLQQFQADSFTCQECPAEVVLGF